MAAQVIGRSHIGDQHALLNELVGIVAHHRNDGFDLLVLAKDNPGFSGIEIDGAALLALRQQGLIDLIEVFQIRHYLAILVTQGLIIIDQHRCDLVIGQPCMRAHHSGIETVLAQLAFLTHLHVADHAQPIDLGVDRAQAI